MHLARSLLSLALLAMFMLAVVVPVWTLPPPLNTHEPEAPKHPARASRATEESDSKELVAKLVVIEASCKPHQAKLKKALENMYTIAKKARAMEEKDVAFKNYFVEGNHVKAFDKKDIFPKDSGHIQDSKLVPEVFKSVVTGGGVGKKFTAYCPTDKQEPRCKRTRSSVRLAMAGRIPTPNPRIAFCPSFFDPHEPETMNDLDTFKFTTNPSVHDTWCLEAPHIFGHLVTAGHTALHEVTHLAFIMGAAIEAAVPGLAKEVVKEITGTLDINQADEDYLPAASRALKKTSQAYFDHLALPNKAGKQAPKEPPLAPIDHAESYAAAATEYYFWKMCGASFKPESVLAQDEAD